MQVKTQFDYEAKQAARQKLVNFIIRYYSKDERKHLQMVCFPGAQALDIFRVSDVLGIPRYNVTGIEENREIYKKLEKKDLGINIFHGNDKEFFENTNERFDIVSLDYFGTLNLDVWKTLANSLFGRQVLKPKSILHTNFFGSREKKSVKRVYTIPDYSVFSDKVIDAFIKTQKLKDGLSWPIFDILGEREGEALQRSKNRSLAELREEITRNIIYMGYMGTLKREIGTGTEQFQFLFAIKKRINQLEEQGVPQHLAIYLYLKMCSPYFCEGLERYRYISDDGSPMLTDIFLFNQHEEWFNYELYPFNIKKMDNGRHVVNVDDYNINEIDLEHPFVKKNLRHAEMVSTYFPKTLELIKPRQFLGSSAKPILLREKAKELIESGVTSEEILQTYRGVARQQLAAYKAWKTMRERKNVSEDNSA
jgi:hypothetical protein